jgi:hypothetical protein
MMITKSIPKTTSSIQQLLELEAFLRVMVPTQAVWLMKE